VIWGKILNVIFLIVVILASFCVISAGLCDFSRMFDVILLLVVILARICVIPGRIL